MSDTGKTIALIKALGGSGGGGGGSSSLEGLTDVDISSPTNGQTLVYNATSEKWENGAGGGSSGVLVANAGIEGSTMTLDKTWQEIHDASYAVIRVETETSTSMLPIIVIGEYYCDMSTMDGGTQTFRATTANDYPSLSIGSQPVSPGNAS